MSVNIYRKKYSRSGAQRGEYGTFQRKESQLPFNGRKPSMPLSLLLCFFSSTFADFSSFRPQRE